MHHVLSSGKVLLFVNNLISFSFLLNTNLTWANNIDKRRQCVIMTEKLMKLGERKYNLSSVITVDEALMTNDQ